MIDSVEAVLGDLNTYDVLTPERMHALHATTNNVDRSSTSTTTTIGEMHIHSRATDGPALATDPERHLARSRDAAQADSGLV